MKIHSKFLFVSYILFLLSVSLFPETVILKSGKSHHGDVTFQNREILKLKGKDGNLLQFQKNEILKVTYKNLNAKEVKKILEIETNKNPQIPNQMSLNRDFTKINSETESQYIHTNKNSKKLEKKKIRWEVVSRSALLPGLGQYHWNEPVWGSVYLLTFIGAVFNYNHAWNSHKEAKLEYQNEFRSLVILSSGNSGFVLNLIDKNNLTSDYRKTGNAVNSASNIVIGVFLICLFDSLLVRAEKKEPIHTTSGIRRGFYLNTEMNQTHDQNLYTRDSRIVVGNVDYKLGYTWVF